MDPTTAEAVKTVSDINLTQGGTMALLGAIAMKLVDKIPFGKMFGGAKKVPVTKSDIDMAILEHQTECRKCMDLRFAETIKEFKEWRKEDMEWRKQDIEERRTFRREVIDGQNRIHKRIDGKADK